VLKIAADLWLGPNGEIRYLNMIPFPRLSR
jgi:hypothetical protein